jgi:hypothetical protein
MILNEYGQIACNISQNRRGAPVCDRIHSSCIVEERIDSFYNNDVFIKSHEEESGNLPGDVLRGVDREETICKSLFFPP